jgi:uncharacterized damage-inducible protein DinB
MAARKGDRLMKTFILAACTVLLATSTALAQTDPLSSAAKQTFQIVKNNVLKSAEQMPESNYAFKATPDVRSFGAILGHIANANFAICSAATGAANPMKGTDIEKTVTSKADLQKALTDAFAFCDAQFDAVPDAKATEMTDFFGGKQPRLNVLQFNTAHDFEHYGNIVTYMRLKGLVPPSSQGRGM